MWSAHILHLREPNVGKWRVERNCIGNTVLLRFLGKGLLFICTRCESESESMACLAFRFVVRSGYDVEYSGTEAHGSKKHNNGWKNITVESKTVIFLALKSVSFTSLWSQYHISPHPIPPPSGLRLTRCRAVFLSLIPVIVVYLHLAAGIANGAMAFEWVSTSLGRVGCVSADGFLPRRDTTGWRN